MQAVRNERGSVIIFATLMIVLLLVMVGLGLDTGQLTYVRNQGQAAVDAAALAAVTGLPSRSDSQVKSRASGFNSQNTYVESPTNSIGNSNVSYVQYDFATNTISNYAATVDTANGVRVALESASSITTPMFLTPLFNLMGIGTANTKDVNVSAVSVITTRPAIPIALWSDLCGATGVQKNDVQIKMQHPTNNGTGENACWTTFLDCSSGASDIKALFTTAQTCSGDAINGAVEIGTPICQNRGQVNSTLHEAEQFFTKDHANSWWLVPVIQGGGNCDPTNPTKVINWAKIYPTFVDDTGNPKYIKANIVCDPTLPNTIVETNLCFSHRLVREKAKNM
jgi:Flp pilus assembly protein TadG